VSDARLRELERWKETNSSSDEAANLLEGRQSLRAEVRRFRAALRELTKDPVFSRLLKTDCPFPAGWCDRASKLLGRYLHEELGLQVRLVSGSWKDWHHAWLEVRHGGRDYVVDVTAAQLPGAPEVSVSQTWHRRFRIADKTSFPLPPILASDVFAREFEEGLADSYRHVLAWLRGSR
jgi:hypothetical protein